MRAPNAVEHISSARPAVGSQLRTRKGDDFAILAILVLALTRPCAHNGPEQCQTRGNPKRKAKCVGPTHIRHSRRRSDIPSMANVALAVSGTRRSIRQK